LPPFSFSHIVLSGLAVAPKFGEDGIAASAETPTNADGNDPDMLLPPNSGDAVAPAVAAPPPKTGAADVSAGAPLKIDGGSAVVSPVDTAPIVDDAPL
jgi:hypothetical protein